MQPVVEEHQTVLQWNRPFDIGLGDASEIGAKFAQRRLFRGTDVGVEFRFNDARLEIQEDRWEFCMNRVDQRSHDQIESHARKFRLLTNYFGFWLNGRLRYRKRSLPARCLKINANRIQIFTKIKTHFLLVSTVCTWTVSTKKKIEFTQMIDHHESHSNRN